MSEKTMRVGISCGDLNGVGLEVVLKAFEDNRMHQDITPVLYCGVKAVSHHRKALKLDDMQIHGVKSVNDIIPRKFNVVDLWDEDVPIELGKPSGQQSKYAIQSLEAAAQDLGQGKIDMLVTAPIDKHSMQLAGFQFPGHTEFLSHLAGSDSPVLMILVGDGLRVALVTGHLPINQVAEAVTTERIIGKARLFNRSLQSDFGINQPRIAVLGLNPHAGDGGAIGSEDKERIRARRAQAAGGRHQRHGSIPRRWFLRQRQLQALRWRARHVPRPGARTVQGPQLRTWRELYGRTAHRAYITGSRYRTGHRRQERGGPRQPSTRRVARAGHHPEP